MQRQPEIFFANCGHGETRKLQDCAKLGFISAGQGREDGRVPDYFGKQIRTLIIGDIVVVYRSKIGFVGIARVVSSYMDINNAVLNGLKVTNETFSEGTKMYNDRHSDYREWLVALNWLTKVHLDDTPKSGALYGEVKLRNVVCTLDNQEEVKNNLEAYFKVDFEKLLSESINFRLSLIKSKTLTEVETKNKEVKEIEIIEELEFETFPEGKEMYILHKKQERSSELVLLAKKLYLKTNPRFPCQVCDFSFFEKYGELGQGFIEAHHILPISELKEEKENTVEDLVFVCSNCHRMLHRNRPWKGIKDLKDILGSIN